MHADADEAVEAVQRRWAATDKRLATLAMHVEALMNCELDSPATTDVHASNAERDLIGSPKPSAKLRSSAQIMRVAKSDQTADERMKAIIALDRHFVGKNSNSGQRS